MKVTFNAGSKGNCVLELSGAEQVPDDVAAVIEVELGIPMQQQQFSFRNALLLEGTVAECGIRDGDVVDIAIARTPAPAVSSSTSSSSQPRRGGAGNRRRIGGGMPARVRIDPATWPALTWSDLPNGIDPTQLHSILKVNEGMMREIERRDPEFYAAARDPLPAKLSGLMMARNLDHALPEAQRSVKLRELESRLAANPFDLEAQQLLEEIIAKKNVR